jgi:hypothetical protein
MGLVRSEILSDQQGDEHSYKIILVSYRQIEDSCLPSCLVVFLVASYYLQRYPFPHLKNPPYAHVSVAQWREAACSRLAHPSRIRRRQLAPACPGRRRRLGEEDDACSPGPQLPSAAARPPPSFLSRRDCGPHHRLEPSPAAAARIPEVLCSSSSSISGSGEIRHRSHLQLRTAPLLEFVRGGSRPADALPPG